MSTTIQKESILQRLGNWFRGLFTEGETLYEALEEYEKEGAQYASGVVAVISHNVDASPIYVKALIQTLFPKLDLAIVHGFLDNLNNILNKSANATPLTLEDSISAMQVYFKSQGTGSTWAIIAHSAAKLLLTFFAPNVPVQALGSLLETVYQTIVRPAVVSLPPASISLQKVSTSTSGLAASIGADYDTSKNTTDMSASVTPAGQGNPPTQNESPAPWGS